MLKIFLVATYIAGTAVATRFHNNSTGTIWAQKSGDSQNYGIAPHGFLNFSDPWAFIWANTSKWRCDGYVFSWPQNYGDVYWTFGTLYDSTHTEIMGGENCEIVSATSSTTSTEPSATIGITEASPTIESSSADITPATTDQLPSSHSGLTGGQIAGVVIGVICAVLLIALLGFLLFRHRRERQRFDNEKTRPDPASSESPSPEYEVESNKVLPSEMEGQKSQPREMEAQKTQPSEMEEQRERFELES